MTAPAALLSLTLAAAAAAQTPPEAAVAPDGAVLRGLDRVSGALEDIEIAPGQTVAYGRLEITLSECRYPAETPLGDAYAHLTIREAGADTPAFDGWMIASSPALMALDHPRYDVWVIRCNNASG